MPTIDAAALSGQADPIAANDPIAVALDPRNVEDTQEFTIPPRRLITFEEVAGDDEIDVPDFMK